MDISEDIKKMVVSRGFKVAVDSEYCKTWKAHHKNCLGCECEDGCGRYVSLLGVMTGSILYKPTSYEDFQNMNKSIQEKMRKILDINTSQDELKAIIW